MASIKKRDNGQWRARYRDAGGKEHARHFGRKVDAQTWLDEVTASVKTGLYVDPKAGKQLVSTYVEDWTERQIHRGRTAETFEGILRLHVLPELGGVRLADVTSSQVQRMVSGWVKAGAAASTIETRYTLVAMIFRAAVKDKRIPVTPCEGIRLPEKRQKSALVPITTDVVIGLRAAMPERYRALITVAAGSGLRRGELFGLTLDRVSERFGTIRVDRQLGKGTGDDVTFEPVKTGASERNVPVADVVMKAIVGHVEQFGVHTSGLVFTSHIATPLRPSTLWMAWNAAAKEVGTDATLHSLRHYFASVQIRGGTSIKALQQMLGHKSATETWDTYGHLMGDEDERSRTVIQSELGNLADSLRTGPKRVIYRRRSEAV